MEKGEKEGNRKKEEKGVIGEREAAPVAVGGSSDGGDRRSCSNGAYEEWREKEYRGGES